MRRMLIIIIINFFAVVLNYNGLTYHSVNLGGNVFLNFAVIASIEIPSYVLTYLTLDRCVCTVKSRFSDKFCVAAVRFLSR